MKHSNTIIVHVGIQTLFQELQTTMYYNNEIQLTHEDNLLANKRYTYVL